MGTKLKLIFTVLIISFICTASTLYAQDFSPKCFMYLHSNFQGPVYQVYANSEVWVLGRPWNDNVSSVIVQPGCQLQVYPHWHFEGFDTRFPTGRHTNVGPAWNDQISSVKCICR
jgi:hypothetical protein